MKITTYIFAVANLAILPCLTYASERQLPVVTKLRSEQRNVGEQLKDARAKALGSDRTAFVLFVDSRMPASLAIIETIRDPLMQEACAGVELVEIDFAEWDMSRLAELQKLGFELKVIPVIAALDGNGKPAGPKINGFAWKEDIPANMAPVLKKFFREAHAAGDQQDKAK